jgi:hypothetical protein
MTLEDIAARHVLLPAGTYFRDRCAGCGEEWPCDAGVLLARCEELEGALRSAHQNIAMTRKHLAADHPDCAYAALGVMNDGSRRALLEGGAS